MFCPSLISTGIVTRIKFIKRGSSPLSSAFVFKTGVKIVHPYGKLSHLKKHTHTHTKQNKQTNKQTNKQIRNGFPAR